MASKATPQDVKDIGFSLEMFKPTVEDEDGFTAFIQEKLDENVDEIKDAIGLSVYEDATRLSDVKRIEKRLAAANLWDIRATLVLADRIPEGPTGAAERKTAEYCRDLAWAVINRLNRVGGSVDISTGSKITSHFDQDA